MLLFFLLLDLIERVTAHLPPKEYNSCSESVQSNLRYNISKYRSTIGIPVAVNYYESLADAVCCDSRVMYYAEPENLYSKSDVNLFGTLNETTIFYDSSCGLPVFQAPVNRSIEDFYQDTKEHGWPSFRADEVFTDNVVTNKTTALVSSICGTHLGTFLPDQFGDRWCIDLSCISGNPLNDSSLNTWDYQSNSI